jgi:hypothetical protein
VISKFVGLFDMGQQNRASSNQAGVLRVGQSVNKQFGRIVKVNTPVSVQPALAPSGPGAFFLRKV